ncbi:MAG: CPBP family intramembrane metalloprotease [Anaerolineales bacterium]|nr:CPBP family intramembrane metalloprotease [Anaerolineales bacterium]
MKTQMTFSSAPQHQTARERVLAYFAQHPVTSAFAIFFAYLVISTALGLAAKVLLPQFQPEFVVLIALAVLVALALTGLGWWRVAGFNGPVEWRDLGVVIIPFLIVIGLPFLKGINLENGNSFWYLVVAYALTGFMEEGLMRGIVLRVLKPVGVTRSVVLSALLFGLMHIGNVLYRNPVIVLAQMLGAFVEGTGLAAIRLRTNTIWFVVLLHGLHDLFLKYTNFPPIPLDVVQVTLTMLWGIYILRTWKERETAVSL